MLAKNIEILVSSVTDKVNSKTNLPYLALSILTLDDGTTFNVLEKDSKKFGLYRPMGKCLVDLKINSSRYGRSVVRENVLADRGNILVNSSEE